MGPFGFDDAFCDCMVASVASTVLLFITANCIKFHQMRRLSVPQQPYVELEDQQGSWKPDMPDLSDIPEIPIEEQKDESGI